jgi:hypothetical protein
MPITSRRSKAPAGFGHLLLLTALVSLGTSARTEEAPVPQVSTVHSGWGLSGNLGTGGAGGDFGNLFREPISAELNLFRRNGAWRYGFGVSFGSFNMKEPYQDEQEWAILQTYVFGTRMFRTQGVARPYLQLRGGTARLHPRSTLFAPTPLPEDLEPGESPTEAVNGFGVGVVPGVEFHLSPAFALDASLSANYFKTGEYDLSAVGQPPRSSGTYWEARIGASWVPNGGQEPHGDTDRDAWGVRRSYGWAAGETMAINVGAGLIIEYVRDANFTQVSPRSWWENLEEGFTYDDNQFKTNQWAHPFNGAAYYNSGRANGLGFWPSAGFAAVGAFQWECCGETHPMSFNDLISTGIGGIALGEAQYRLSSEILDNRDTGKSHVFREIGAFLVDPIRGFNRLVSGHAKGVADNPSDPMDWRPEGAPTFVATGVRVIGEGSSISENTQSYATILLNHSYGNVFENTRRKPFDYMDFVAEMNFGEKVGLGNVQIRGDLASWALGSAQAPNHVLQLVQHFDYMNNNAYEFGGQSVGAALSSRFRLSDKVRLSTRLDGNAIILGAVNADYSWLADVADQERVREYDYGPGLGAMATATLSLNGRPLLSALYRFAWISVSNGSVYDRGTVGSDADHYIQGGGLRLVVPIKGSVGLGADAYLFNRNSHYLAVDAADGSERRNDVSQRNPQVRVYLAFSSVRSRS